MSARITWVLSCVLGLFFLYAGAMKLLDVAAFSEAIEQYHLVSGAMAWGVALWIPWIECVAAVGLWIKRLHRGALWILAGLLLVFEGVLLTAMVRGLDISCGCLGAGTESSVLLALGRNLILLAAIGWLMLKQRNPR